MEHCRRARELVRPWPGEAPVLLSECALLSAALGHASARHTSAVASLDDKPRFDVIGMPLLDQATYRERRPRLIRVWTRVPQDLTDALIANLSASGRGQNPASLINPAIEGATVDGAVVGSTRYDLPAVKEIPSGLSLIPLLLADIRAVVILAPIYEAHNLPEELRGSRQLTMQHLHRPIVEPKGRQGRPFQSCQPFFRHLWRRAEQVQDTAHVIVQRAVLGVFTQRGLQSPLKGVEHYQGVKVHVGVVRGHCQHVDAVPGPVVGHQFARCFVIADRRRDAIGKELRPVELLDLIPKLRGTAPRRRRCWQTEKEIGKLGGVPRWRGRFKGLGHPLSATINTGLLGHISAGELTAPRLVRAKHPQHRTLFFLIEQFAPEHRTGHNPWVATLRQAKDIRQTANGVDLPRRVSLRPS